jgi:DNA-binding IclR family transcriptional regulator
VRLALNAAAPQDRLDSARYPSVAAALVNAAKEIGDQVG